MASTASYIPAKQSLRATWMQNFSDLINAAPATYGLDAAAAAAILSANTAFQAAYAAAINPVTRTPVAVSDKNSQMIAAVLLCRTYASQIRINPGVTNPDKIALGLNLPNTSPSPIPAPTTFPLLTFLSGAPLTHQFSYKDSGTAVGKAKAPGAVQMQLVAGVAALPLTDPSTLVLKATPTKSPFQVAWGSGDAAKVATYAARWATRTGLVGPWSALSSFTVLSS